MLSLAWIMMLFNFRVDMDLYVFSKRALWELEGQRLLSPFNGEHLERMHICWASPISPKDKLLGSHMVG